MSALPPAAYAAALASFERMSVHRLLALLRHHRADDAFAVAAGDQPPEPGGLVARVLDVPEVRDAWRRSARTHPPEQVWERCLELGVEVTVLGEPGHPALLAIDPLPPPVLFSLGDRQVLEGRRVALVGTRNATGAGRHVARSFGRGLTESGVHVVSGLARGIDGQAHAGCFDVIDAARAGDDASGRPLGRPVAVVASGPDVVYPREHRALWQRVAADGLLLTESPPGAAPVAHRFPQRNRLIASLAEIVVVVESRETGGSLITASLAAERGVPVMAVPGHAASRAALGVNGLLRDGSAPAIDVTDVLVALGLDHARVSAPAADGRVPPRPSDRATLRACASRALTVGEVALATGASLVDSAMALARLEQAGWVAEVDGWFEAVGSPRR